VSYVEGVVKEG
jgi:hypothetical protein